MKPAKPLKLSFLACLAVSLGAFAIVPAARANVYATDIRLNGTLTNTVSVSVGSSVTLTYHLNDNATAGVTINLRSNATVVAATNIASPNAGTLMGLNTVSLAAPGSAGIYSVSITAISTGYAAWQQISKDTNPGNVAVFPHGMAVDNNPVSPYYGRVFVNNGLDMQAYGLPQSQGIYKYNADATLADEGAFGYGNYITNNSGQAGVNTFGYLYPQMAAHGTAGHGQEKMRVGTDDRVYMCDYSNDGSIVAFDPLISTNQMVIDQGATSGNFPAAPNYSGNPDFSELANGIDSFDVTPTGANPAVWLGDNDYPGWGLWMYHMTNGTADPADNVGAQAVAQNSTGVGLVVASAGCMIDTNLDIFVASDRGNAADPYERVMVFSNWNGGVLAPEGASSNKAVIIPSWEVGANDDTLTGIVDTLINSRTKPTLVALPMYQGAPETYGYSGANGGIRVLNAADAFLTVTRASLNGTNLTINCVSSSPYAPVLSQLSLVSTTTLNGNAITNPVAGTFTGGNGVFQATTTVSGSAGFYQVVCPHVAGTVVQVENNLGAVTQALTNLDAGNWYSCAAFDNVGNLYGASTTTNYWRVWSPPGANTNTTVAAVSLTTH